ncbi:hypothetical protein GE061_017470 [Apolygus lucorum]|uniref:Uncharacterized protein n=1 Tax=Apolygus lucorum TaxID=248454 RepID=A0A8S9XD67_APOLU|nr:hypothetical protein GE061_017470 [Apolygus lucorum]
MQLPRLLRDGDREAIMCSSSCELRRHSRLPRSSQCVSPAMGPHSTLLDRLRIFFIQRPSSEEPQKNRLPGQ